jgi:hypothetical protein
MEYIVTAGNPVKILGISYIYLISVFHIDGFDERRTFKDLA